MSGWSRPHQRGVCEGVEVYMGGVTVKQNIFVVEGTDHQPPFSHRYSCAIQLVKARVYDDGMSFT